MNKKNGVSNILKDMESLIHKMIDEKRDGPFTSFELIMITTDALIKELETKSLLGDIVKVGNA